MKPEVPVLLMWDSKELMRIGKVDSPLTANHPQGGMLVDGLMRLASACLDIRRDHPAAWQVLQKAGVSINAKNIEETMRMLDATVCEYEWCSPGMRCVRHQYCLACPNCKPDAPCGCSGPGHACEVNPAWPDAPREPQRAFRTATCSGCEGTGEHAGCNGTGVTKFAIPCPRCSTRHRELGTPYPYLVTRDVDPTKGEQYCEQCGYPGEDTNPPQKTVINGFDYGVTKPDGQHERYPTLSAEERAKGFVRPVRQEYAHVGRAVCGDTSTVMEKPAEPGKVWACTMQPGHDGEHESWGQMLPEEAARQVQGGCGGTVTWMGLALAETYARQPDYYGATYCTKCRTHPPVGPFGEFVWVVNGKASNERVGT